MNMELPSLLLNEKSWSATILGENALLIEGESNSLQDIQTLAFTIEKASLNGIVDIVPAYDSLALIFDAKIWNHHLLLGAIKELPAQSFSKAEKKIPLEIPVCYDFGLDWKEVTEHTRLSEKEAINIHSSSTYTVAMMGFIPGFVFLKGLDERLSVPRKSIPRKTIPSGSVGIGGRQTGVYSLESPGGWNIIGRTPVAFFDVLKDPPTKLNAGDLIRFTPISEKEFQNG